MHPNLLAIPAHLSDQLKRQTDELLSGFIRSNCGSQFAQMAPELAAFRNATSSLIDNPAMDDSTLSESFRKMVQFTTYDSYAPLIAKFFETPCKASAVTDLLAPGLPDYLARSSSTSGGRPKFFPWYNCLSNAAPSKVRWRVISDPPLQRTQAYISHLYYELMHLADEEGHTIRTVYLTVVSSVIRRSSSNLHPDEDEEKMPMFMNDHVAPYAARFIKNYRSFLLIHALFAVGSRSLETITIPYTSMFVDMMRHLSTEFDTVVHCIASGTIPDLEGIDKVRHHLEVNMLPDPERAAELRQLGPPSSRMGWCSDAWPNMHSIVMTSSGSFATYTPSAQYYLGPEVNISPRGYGSTEARIAGPYNPRESNQFKLYGQSVVEFLDIENNEDIGDLAQSWEVKVGRRYEVVVTTINGLWRYRLGDVIEICGFDPADGVAIIKFIERRNVALRFPKLTVTEEELGAAILSIAPNTPVRIVGWTAAVDHRRTPATIGFFVELADDQVCDLTLAPQHVFDQLFQSVRSVAQVIDLGLFRMPTIRLVPPGTFSTFIQMKLNDAGGNNFGQVKVPVVLSKPEYVAWFSDRILREL